MDNEEFAHLETLHHVYERAQQLCDPKDFEHRQHLLLHQTAETLLFRYVREKKDREAGYDRMKEAIQGYVDDYAKAVSDVHSGPARVLPKTPRGRPAANRRGLDSKGRKPRVPKAPRMVRGAAIRQKDNDRRKPRQKD